MTYCNQLILVLLTAGHVYCLQEIPLKDGNIFKPLETEPIVNNAVLNGTHIETPFSYNIAGFIKSSEAQKNLTLSVEGSSISDLQLKNRHHHIENCNIHIKPSHSEYSDEISENLKNQIRDDICKRSATLNNDIIDLYEDKNNDLKNMAISQSEYLEARDAFDSVFDAALFLAQKKLKGMDFIDPSRILTSGSWNAVMSQLQSLQITNLKFGNLSTIERARSVVVSKDSDVLSLNVLLKINLAITFNLPKSVEFKILAPKTVAGATIKLDYSKEKCQILVDDVELNFNNSLKTESSDYTFDYNQSTLAKFGELDNFFSSGLLPELLKPQIKSHLSGFLNQHVNCENMRPMNHW